MKVARTNDGRKGDVMRHANGIVTVKFRNGKVKDYRENQVTILENIFVEPATGLSHNKKLTLIDKYSEMLKECRNDQAKRVLEMIINDLKG